MYLFDSAHVWHVAKTGNDGNSGHAAQYPVSLASDAKLTIAAALAAAASGDTIVIWPGDYAEAVDASAKTLRIIGADRAKTRITPATGTPLTIGPDSYVRDLSAIGPSGGVYGTLIPLAGSGVTLENVYTWGDTDGLYVMAASGTLHNLRLIRCHFKSDWDGAKLSATEGVFADRCLFETTGCSNASHALQLPGSGVYRGCQFRAKTTETGSAELGAVNLAYGYNIRAVFDACHFYCEAPAGRTGEVFGIKVADADDIAVLRNCVFVTIGAGASGGPQDIRQEAGSVIVAGCGYATTYGTIVQGGSGKIDQAIKSLINKAVQNKATGVITYYDDDGVTALLTATPTDGATTITRTPS